MRAAAAPRPVTAFTDTIADNIVRLILIVLTVMLILIQYPLWLGKGSWLRVWDLSRQLDSALVKEQELKEGTCAVEERARYELGLIKDNEVFVQILESDSKKVSAEAASRTAGH